VTDDTEKDDPTSRRLKALEEKTLTYIYEQLGKERWNGNPRIRFQRPKDQKDT